MKLLNSLWVRTLVAFASLPYIKEQARREAVRVQDIAEWHERQADTAYRNACRVGDLVDKNIWLCVGDYHRDLVFELRGLKVDLDMPSRRLHALGKCSMAE